MILSPDFRPNDGSPVRPSDLVGCRYRLRQRLTHPEIGPTAEGLARAERVEAAREVVFGLVPVGPAVGDGRSRAYRRVHAHYNEQATREALRKKAHVVTGGMLNGVVDGVDVQVEVDILVRHNDNTYIPVMISNHRVARASQKATMLAIPTHRLGLSSPLEYPVEQRHHTIDGYRVAVAALLLGEKAHPLAGVIGQDRTMAYLAPVAGYIDAVRDALAQPTPTKPRRLKQCASCRFWPVCEPELREMDEISLVFPGGRARPFRERGIHTVSQAAAANFGEMSTVARAWQQGIPVLARSRAPQIPRADVEIDIDLEAYLDQGAYLWGAFDGETYHAFVTWDEVGGRSESENFAAFWEWLIKCRSDAVGAGKTFAAYCYAAGGENHWLMSSARRFGVVDEAEVRSFIRSDEWIDVFAYVKRQLVGVDGLGLKVVAPLAGYDWEDAIDGEASVAYRRQARLGNADARDLLLRYNEDDCRATRAVRDFLQAGAPGIPLVEEV